MTPKDQTPQNNQFVTSQRYTLGKGQSVKHPYEKTVYYLKSEQSPTLKSPNPHSVKSTNVKSIPVTTSHIYMKVGASNPPTPRADSGYASRQGNTQTPTTSRKSVTIVTPNTLSPNSHRTQTPRESPEPPSSTKFYENNKLLTSGEKEKDKMSYYTTDIISPTSVARKQEKEELQLLNDRFTSYVSRVRQLSEHTSQLDSASFIKQTRILEEEVANLKTLYERELDAMR